MKALTEKFLHYGILVGVTILAIGVMWSLSAKDPLAGKKSGTVLRSLPAIAAPKSPVAIETIEVQTCEILATYAGKIQSWETYQIGFAVGGRVTALGENKAGKPLDDGDQVQAGQVLARLDDRVFRARRSEAAAQVEQAVSDLQRAERIRSTNPEALSESELHQLVTQLALARAQHEVAEKNLDDATLTAPVDATISKRLIKSGESVNPNQIVFELVENDQVLLVVDVPESRIRQLEGRLRDVERNRAAPMGQIDPEDAVFRAYVRLLGRDRFGNRWEPLEGEVYRIAEVADSRTGLFPVEIRLTNADGLLRPGMVATADVVVGRLAGYQIPEAAVIIRRRSAHLFTVVKETTDMEVLYWNVGPAEMFRAQRVPLTRWIDQGPHVVVPASEVDLSTVVVRGHLRLADGQFVRVVNEPTPRVAIEP